MRRATLPLLLFIACLAGCGGDSHEKITQDMLAIAEDIGDVLAGIEQPDQIKLAMEEVDALTEKLGEILLRIKELGDPDAATEQQLQDTYDKLIEDEIARWQTEAMRINEEVVQNNPALAIPIQVAFNNLAMMMFEFAEEQSKE
jgi:hypothetical protein